ncbi:agmatine deiminase family protein [Candidatus Sumerlaeota bacterium]|nr:agmatine deiminase family protein [Candidatus Sumerlaeota bacterium]
MITDGLRMPAEWEPHAATWLTWPHSALSWPGKRLAQMPALWAKMIRAIAPGEEVHLLVQDEAMEARAREALREHAADAPSVHLHCVPTDECWLRDNGPIFVKEGERTVITGWEYNAWGGKYPPYDLDIAVPDRIAEITGLSAIRPGMILEGGSIDVNGAGLLLTTEQCLLNPNRNPTLSREEVKTRLHRHLGAERILWLGEGLEGDETDGHIDVLTRFVAVDTVVSAIESNPRDTNHAPLRENRERLDSMTGLDGRPLRVIELPMPPRVDHAELGARLPASYANFYIANAAVLVPVYGHAARDGEALEILTACFPDREIVAIEALDLIWGGGAVHCVTQQQPL